MTIDARLLEEDLRALHDIGKDNKGGITRLAYSPKDNESHDYIKTRMEKLGFATRYDEACNLYISQNRNNNRKIVLGSHLDSVPNGGNYDGVVGIITGAEILRAIKRDGIALSHDLELVIFRGEESSRFGTAMIGSNAVTGTLLPSDLEKKDTKGKTMREAIKKSGGNPDSLRNSIWNPQDISCYLETHIEQGRVLQDTGKQIGIVTGIAAPVRYWIDLYGRKDHSGNTPMGLRADPLDAFYDIGNWKKKTLGNAYSLGYPTVATIGEVLTPGGSMNTIPGHVRFCMDIRDINLDRRNIIENSLLNGFNLICETEGITMQYKESERKEPVSLPDTLIKNTEKVCNDLGYPYHIMPCGAGHDGLPLTHFGIKTAMILIPSKDGLSHQKGEYSSLHDILCGAHVAYESVLRLDRSLR